MKDKIDDHVNIDEFEDIVRELEDQATINEELDKANIFLVEENIKLKKHN